MTQATAFEGNTLYTRQFFQIFAAVILFMTGHSLQFHFGQYIGYLGHGVDTLGQILSISMVGTLLIRLQLGRWIDRFGCRPGWVVGTLLFTLGVGSVQFVERLWLITILRMLSTMAMAGVMTTIAVFAAQIAPPPRRAESIGTIGLAGFLGMIIGPTLGDWIFAESTDSIVPYRVFFTASAACSLAACAVMIFASLPESCGPARSASTDTTSSGSEQVSMTRVILKHWPGSVLLVGLVFSMVFCLQIAFLERLAEERGFHNVKAFFLTYGPTAIVLRVVFRRVPEQLGRTRTLLGGLLLLATGLFFLVGIRSEQELILPALLMGAGHCFIFPSMVDLSAERLPPAHRGMGTSLILGAGDLGILIGFFGMGELIDARGFDATLAALGICVLIGAAVFGCLRRQYLFRRRPTT